MPRKGGINLKPLTLNEGILHIRYAPRQSVPLKQALSKTKRQVKAIPEILENILYIYFYISCTMWNTKQWLSVAGWSWLIKKIIVVL